MTAPGGRLTPAKFDEINRAALGDLPRLLGRWLPKGRTECGEWVALNPTRVDRHLGSFRINLQTGKWADFAADARGGDVVSLAAYLHGITQSEAAIELAGHLGMQIADTSTGSASTLPTAKAKPMNNAPSAVLAPFSKDEIKSSATVGRERVHSFQSKPANKPPAERCFKHPEFGIPALRCQYYNEEGQLLGYTARDWTDANGKVTHKEPRPLFFGTENNSYKLGWHWRRPKAPLVLFNLLGLLADTSGPILVVEGEKKAVVAAEMLGWTVISPIGGAQSPHLTDWQPLHRRDVVIWPDNNQPGAGFATKVAGLVLAAGASSALIVDVTGLPEGWDLADPLPAGWTIDAVRKRLDEAAPSGLEMLKSPSVRGIGARILVEDVEADAKAPLPVYEPALGPTDGLVEEQRGFRLVRAWVGDDDNRIGPGIYRGVESTDKETKEVTTEWVWFGSLLEILASSRDRGSEEWGRYLAVHDSAGIVHFWPMPMSMTVADGAEYRRELARLGFVLSSASKARKWLADYLTMWSPPTKVLCVDRVGWHGSRFVLPTATDDSFQDGGNLTTDGDGPAGERIVLQSHVAPPAFTVAGSLEEWQQRVGSICRGNSRLMFSVSVALAGPLLHVVSEESGGFHFLGRSSIGKSIALQVAASVYGRKAGSWRTTDNGLEGMARSHNDLLLTLDEIGQCSSQAVGEIVYMVSNGVSKSRMRQDTSSRPSATWRLLFLSSGEVDLATKMGEDGRGKRPMAGQAVRMIELPADAGAGLGLFERLHGHPDGVALAETISAATKECSGTAGRRYLHLLEADLDKAASRVRALRTAFVEAHRPKGSDGQVLRALGRFALVAAAGELGVDMGILPWEPGEAEAAAVRCFQDWVEARGGVEPAEVRDAVERVRLFIEQHGMSRFEPSWAQEEAVRDAVAGCRPPPPEVRIVNSAGFRRLGENGWTYYVKGEAWKTEVCKGMDAALVARVLFARSYLEPGDTHRGIRRPDKKARVPNQPDGPRYFVIRPSILGDDDD